MTSVYTSSPLIMIGLFQESKQYANLRIVNFNLQAENEEVRQSIIQSNRKNTFGSQLRNFQSLPKILQWFFLSRCYNNYSFLLKNIKEPKSQEKKKENYTNYCNCWEKMFL